MADSDQTVTSVVPTSGGADSASSSSVSAIPANVEKPSVESVPVTETKAEAAPVENILGDTKSESFAEIKEAENAPVEKVTEAKTPEKPENKVETKPETKTEPEKKAEGEAPVLPSYELKFPETVKLDAEPVAAFTKILAEIETGKLDHAALESKGQALVDMHIKGVNDSIEKLNDFYVNFHENQKKEWFDSFKKDPDLGGDNITETVSNLRTAVEKYAGDEKQAAEFRQVMKDTGVGNHPAVIRMLRNMDAKIRKYETEGNQNRIVPAQKPAPSKVKDYQRFYTGG